MPVRLLYVIPVVAIFCLSACSQEPQPPKATYTVDDYLANPQIREAKLAECANNPGELAQTPDCVNVKAATKRHGIGSLDDLPPIKFSTPDSASKKPD
jgi:hypothetical protein